MRGFDVAVVRVQGPWVWTLASRGILEDLGLGWTGGLAAARATARRWVGERGRSLGRV